MVVKSRDILRMEGAIRRLDEGFKRQQKRQKILDEMKRNVLCMSGLGFSIATSSSNEERAKIQKEMISLGRRQEKLKKRLEVLR